MTMAKYYMTQRPPMPGAMPTKGLDTIEDLDWRDEIPYLGKGAYALLTYDHPLTEKEISDYELIPYERETRTYKGYEIAYIAERCWAVTSIDNPKLGVVAYVDTLEEAMKGIDEQG